MSKIKFQCSNPKCGAVLSLSEEMQGRRVRCAACGSQLQVPLGRTSRISPRRRLRKAG